MKYIIMAGGRYDKFSTPKHLLKVNGEVLIERTIRLLKENGIKDIAISTNNPDFDYLKVEKLRHKNEYVYANKEKMTSQNCWLNAYYPTEQPACYLYGDVYYTEEAIETIVNTEVKDTMFFCVRDISDGRPAGINSKGREPLAYKVENQKVFRKAINKLFELIDNGKFTEEPVSWNLYRQINNLSLDYHGYGNGIFDTNGDYVVIDDCSTDVDNIEDIEKIEKLIKIMKGEIKMIKLKVKEEFTLGRFNELKNIVRARRDEKGKLFVGDIFECDEELANYLTKEHTINKGQPNEKKIIVAEVIETIPEKVNKEQPKEVKKTTTKKPAAKKTTKKKITKKEA